MDLKHLLLKKRESILGRWLRLIFDSYGPESGSLLMSPGDRFANPVGYTIQDGAGQLLDGLIRGDDPRTLHRFLETIMRIRAVQDFTAPQAVAFIGGLKTVVREEVMDRTEKYGLQNELNDLEIKIDHLARAGTEQYSGFKDRIREIAAREIAGSADFRARVTGKCRQ